MRPFALFLIGVCVGVSALAAPTATPVSAPLRFEPNRGQLASSATDPVLWSARGLDYAFLFTSKASVLALGDRAVRATLVGSDRNATYHGEQADAGKIEYFSSSYRGPVTAFHRLTRTGVYPGIDVTYYGNGQQLEYDFKIAPGADASKIRIHFDGADHLRLTSSGDLQLTLGSRDVTQRAPVSYQINANGERVPVASSYQIAANGNVTLKLGAYDKSRALVVDPVITYARYLFGAKSDVVNAITHDANGNVYIAGYTFSTDFYIQGDYYNIGNRGGQDAWVQKIVPSASDGNYVPYTTYYGGAANDIAKAIALDGNGRIYITGTTTSTDLPTTSGAYAATNKGATDAFIAVFDPKVGAGSGSLTFATYFGGTAVEDARAIATFGGVVYIAGSTPSSDLPTVNPIDASSRAGTEIFISGFDITKSGTATLVASTYIDASASDYPRSMAIDASGMIYVAGVSYSPDIPTPGASYQTVNSGNGDGFLLKVDLANKQILYGTYIGGSGIDEIRRVVIETPTRVAVAGYTLSSEFPTTQNAYQPLPQGSSDAFVAVFDLTQAGPSGLLYSTVFGGAQGEVLYDMARDSGGRYYIGGYTLSQNLYSEDHFPISTDALNQVSAGGGVDGFFAIIDRTKGTNGLIYSSYVTGLGSQIVYAVDAVPGGVAYAAGSATADIFPAGQPVHETPAGSTDGFILGMRFPELAALSNSLTEGDSAGGNVANAELTGADQAAAALTDAAPDSSSTDDASAQSQPESDPSPTSDPAPASPDAQ
ncbi:MAG: SBBP repeat-containing protein [Bryobacteraceae bacterium]